VANDWARAGPNGRLSIAYLTACDEGPKAKRAPCFKSLVVQIMVYLFFNKETKNFWPPTTPPAICPGMGMIFSFDPGRKEPVGSNPRESR